LVYSNDFKHVRKSVPQGRWKTILKQTGMKYRGLHHLRHTHVANWCSVPGNNKDPYALQRRLGHKDLDTTLRKYGHYFDFAEREKTLSTTAKIKEMVAQHK